MSAPNPFTALRDRGQRVWSGSLLGVLLGVFLGIALIAVVARGERSSPRSTPGRSTPSVVQSTIARTAPSP